MSRPRTLDISDELEIVRLYLEEKLTTAKIGLKYNLNAETIGNIVRRNGGKLRTRGESNKLSTTFTFSEMTREKAFLLGLIYGDGSISIRQDYINITSGDLDLLEKAKCILEGQFKIEKAKHQQCYSGVIYSRKLCEELLHLFALTNNKSDKLVFPLLPDDIMPFFISGYLATDGCISINKGKWLTVSFYSCSGKYLSDLSDYISKATNIQPSKVRLRKNSAGHLGKKPLYTLRYTCSKAKLVCEYIFRNTSDLTRSDRKFGKYRDFSRITE